MQRACGISDIVCPILRHFDWTAQIINALPSVRPKEINVDVKEKENFIAKQNFSLFNGLYSTMRKLLTMTRLPRNMSGFAHECFEPTTTALKNERPHTETTSLRPEEQPPDL